MIRSRIQSVAHAEALARRRLPSTVYEYVRRGSDEECTIERNVRAFSDVSLVGRAAAGVGDATLDTTLLGNATSAPVVLAPVGFLGLLHPHGDVAAARAAAARGLTVATSTLASSPVEEVTATGAGCWYQLYFAGGDAAVHRAIDRAERAGCAALCVTVDFAAAQPNDRQTRPLPVPDRVDAALIRRHGAAVARHPRWAARFLAARTGFTAPNVIAGPAATPMTIGAAARSIAGTPVTWATVEALRHRWPGSLVVKGIMHATDAVAARDCGADAVVVSNHGGRALDAGPATIEVLPSIAAAVGGDLEIYVDGGVRRGSDIVRARALGARAVLIGRAYAWGLAAGGAGGVGAVLDLLLDGARATLRAIGAGSIDEVGADVLARQPEGGRDAR